MSQLNPKLKQDRPHSPTKKVTWSRTYDPVRNSVRWCYVRTANDGRIVKGETIFSAEDIQFSVINMVIAIQQLRKSVFNMIKECNQAT